MDPITKAFVTAIHRYVNDHDLPLVDFRPGERKDDIAQRYLAGHDGTEGGLQAAISLGAAWRKLVREPLGDLTDAWPSPLRRAYNQLHQQLEAYTAA
ncbi:MAG TPA: hypothetical protein VIV12_26895 [Streptosporangiaceae bacterium]